MKRIAVLGSTGSIGRSTLEVVRAFPSQFRVTVLSTNRDIDTLFGQIKTFRPGLVCVRDEEAGRKLQARLRGKRPRVLRGESGVCEAVSAAEIDIVMMAISGTAALPPLLAAIGCGKDIALANKEALVAAGPVIMREALRRGVKVIPVDSEQSAIWQCLQGQERSRLRRIYLTASGGPFHCVSRQRMARVSRGEVLRHPRWKMGQKITVDSATLMNKGLELIEAMHLFGASADDIQVLIHPEAIIHSMVEYVDGVIMAQLSVTDMRIPIQYALSYPERFPSGLARLDFFRLGSLNFSAPDFKKFPCLALALRAARQLGTLPCVMSAANEASVEAFLKGELAFMRIPQIIEKVMDRHRPQRQPALPDILRAQEWAGQEARALIGRTGMAR